MSFLKNKKMLNIIGLGFIIIAFIINSYSLIRLLLVIIGFIIIILNRFFNYSGKILYKILLSLFLIIVISSLDYGFLTLFHRVPILAKEVVSSDSMRLYKGFSYRVYDCDGNLTIDRGSSKRYVCDENLLPTIDINTFLENPKDNYKNYKNKFIKLTGKISKISGSNTLELEKYTKDEDNTLNGYVIFNDSYTVKTTFANDVSLTNSRIYDEVTIIGRVTTLDKDNNYKITLEDSVIIPSTIYDTYTVLIKTNTSDEYIKLTNNYYLYNLDYLHLKYDEENIYELQYVLLDKRLTIKDFIGVDPDTITENTLFTKDNYNVLVCQNKKVIFGSKKLSDKDLYCTNSEEQK